MTAHRDLKKIIRERQARTGESYMAARTHILRAQGALVGVEAVGDPATATARRVEAAILKLNPMSSSARVRVLGEGHQLTVRAAELHRLAPGMIVELELTREWTHRGSASAAGEVGRATVDVARLGLAPLPFELDDLPEDFSTREPFPDEDPYSPMYRRLTAEPRPSGEMHEIAWGALDPQDSVDFDGMNLVREAAEMADAGDTDNAHTLLMEVLCRDLRCIDAHAHLGNLAFDRPAIALVHYDLGVRIGELSLPKDYQGVLCWGRLHNRPFLRCVQGYALCLWRLGRLDEARRAFERVLSLNPSDNQGARFCLHDLLQGRPWEEAIAAEEAPRPRRKPRQLVH